MNTLSEIVSNTAFAVGPATVFGPSTGARPAGTAALLYI